MGTLLLLGGLLSIGMFTIGVGQFLVAEDALSKADVIVVLGGDGSNFYRTRRALQLFNEDRAPVIVFSGGTSLRDAGLACSSAQLSLDAAQQLGLPEDAAIIAGGAQSTYDEAVNLRRLVQRHGWHSLIPSTGSGRRVVTSLFHTRRAGRTFRTLLPDTTIYVSAVPDPDQDAGHWWHTEDGLVTVINEVLKLGFYWIEYGITPAGW